jgi:Zn-dependent M28 family amino/carboxypeptidase
VSGFFRSTRQHDLSTGTKPYWVIYLQAISMNTAVKLILLLGVIALYFSGFWTTSKPMAYLDYQVSIENLQRTVHYLSAMQPPRNYLHRESLEKAAQYIAREFAEYGLPIAFQQFEISGQSYKNVIARIGPQTGPRLIVGAHYDVCGEQPGADDNASGIAGLLEIARFAKTHEAELPYGIDFVAYTLEEPPFFRTPQMGSYVHAQSLKEQNTQVKGMICLEMIGYFNEQPASQNYPLAWMQYLYGDKGDFIGVISNLGSSSLAAQVSRQLKKTTLKVKALKAPAWLTGVDFSDHQSYWRFGYKAIMVSDTSFYRNTHYHQASDTIDTLDFNKMREVVKGVCWALLQMK